MTQNDAASFIFKVSLYLFSAIVLTTFLTFCSLVAGGGGHATMLPAVISFPYANLLGAIVSANHSEIAGIRVGDHLLEAILSTIGDVIAYSQYFVYGAILLLAPKKHRMLAITIIVFAHMIVFIVTLIIGGPGIIWWDCC